MTTLTQGSDPQLEARQPSQHAAAPIAGCFPPFRDPFLAHYPVIQSGAAYGENHRSVRVL